MNGNEFLEQLIRDINTLYTHIHGQTPESAIKLEDLNPNHLVQIREKYEQILNLVWAHDLVLVAQEYFEKRFAEIDPGLRKINDLAYYEIQTLMTLVQEREPVKVVWDCIPASSFTAGTNLIPEVDGEKEIKSDLDFNILVKGFANYQDRQMLMLIEKVTEVLRTNGWQFVEIRTQGSDNEHYVFNKYIDGVEIEFKLRDKDAFDRTFGPVHKYLDDQMGVEKKMYITFIKYQLASNQNTKQTYTQFKKLYYEYAYAQSKVSF